MRYCTSSNEERVRIARRPDIALGDGTALLPHWAQRWPAELIDGSAEKNINLAFATKKLRDLHQRIRKVPAIVIREADDVAGRVTKADVAGQRKTPIRPDVPEREPRSSRPHDLIQIRLRILIDQDDLE